MGNMIDDCPASGKPESVHAGQVSMLVLRAGAFVIAGQLT